MIQLTTLETGLIIAQREMGQARYIGPGQSNPRMEMYLATCGITGQGDTPPWCAAFVNWVWGQVGIAAPNSAWVPDWIDWGQRAVLDANYMPPLGAAVIVVDANGNPEHIGLFAGSPDGRQIYLLGGNQGGFPDNPDTPMIEQNRVDNRLRMPSDNWIYLVPKG